MQLSVYSRINNPTNSIDTFMEFYYISQMKYLASDLLIKGFSNKQISTAVSKAIKIAYHSGVEIHQHFMPFYGAVTNQIIKDCKLSDLGYGLVLLNADADIALVGDFQIGLLKTFLKNK